MELRAFPGHNVVIAKDQPDYLPMPALAIANPEREVICCWQLSDEERAKVAETGVIWHSVWTFGKPLQPQMLAVDEPEAVGAARALGLTPAEEPAP